MAWPQHYEAVEDWVAGKNPATDPVVIYAEDMNYLRRLLAGRPWVNLKEKATAATADFTDPFMRILDEEFSPGEGGLIIVPQGEFRLLTPTTANGFSWVLPLSDDDLIIQGFGDRSRLIFDGGGASAGMVIGGGPKAARAAGNVNNWPNYFAYVGDTTTIHSLSGPVAEGATTLPPLANPADAANYVPGDYITIRTGQLNAGNATWQPDAEIGKVATADPITGILTLQWPTVKAYQQEWYITGTSGPTSTVNTGNAAPLGVAKLTDRIAQNITLRDLFIEQRANRHAIIGGQVDGLTCERVNALCTGGLSLFSTGSYRRFTWRDSTIYHENLAGDVYIGGPDAGCSEVTIQNVHAYAGSGTPFLHIQEGATGVLVDGLTIRCPEMTGDTNRNLLSIRTRAQARVYRCDFQGGGDGNSAFVDETCTRGGEIIDNRIRNSVAATHINVRGVGWRVGPNDCDRVHLAAPEFNQAPGPQIMEHLSQWVADDQQNPPLGRLPARCYVTNVRVQVTQAFNSDGTDLLTGGYDGAVSALFSAVDVSTTGIKTVTLGALVGYNATARDLKLYFTPGGSQPNTGRAYVAVEFYRTAREVA